MSSSARTDLLIYIAVALTTTIGLFVVHAWYATYLDQRYHAELATRGASEALLAAREEEQTALSGAKLPIAQAMSTIARQGRPASVTPAASADLSPVSGWIHARGFKPATAHPVRVPAPPKPAAVEPQPEAPAAAPEAPKPAKPGPRQLQLKTEVVRPQVAH